MSHAKWSAVAAVLLATAWAEPVRADEESDRAAAAAVSKAIATPLYNSSNEGFYADRGFNGEFQRMAKMVDGLSRANPTDAAAKAAKDALASKAGRSSAYLYRYALNDNLAPIGMDLMKAGLPFALKDEQTDREKFDLGVAVGKLVGNRFKAYDLRTDYRAATPGVRDAAAGFASHVARFANRGDPSKAHGEVFGIDFDSSWNRRFANDSVKLTNQSGATLTRCTILVTLHDGSSTRSHLHHLDSWAPSTTMVGVYKGESDFAADESLNDVDKVTVAVMSDQFSHTKVHKYFGADRDGDIARYCEKLDFSLWSLAPVKNAFVTDHRGVKIGFTGLPSIPVTAVTITMKQGDKTVPLRWAFKQPWQNGTGFAAQKFRDASFNALTPTGYDMEIEFPGTTYRHKVSWTVK